MIETFFLHLEWPVLKIITCIKILFIIWTTTSKQKNEYFMLSTYVDKVTQNKIFRFILIL